MNDKLKSIFNCELCDNKPCSFGCPLNNDIKNVIDCVKKEDYKEAFNTFLNTTVLMPLCGRVCPYAKQCEGGCIKKRSKKKVKIGKIETFIGDTWLNEDWIIESPKETKYNVAVIGSGPAGLTCAAFLRRNGIGVTIYEKHDYLGGLFMHGIPDFRLSKNLVNDVTQKIIDLGITVKYNMELGKNLKFDYLRRKYDAIFIGIGANNSNKMHIEGERLKGVYGANELLENNLKVDFENKSVFIVGGGDVAMDTARTIVRNNAKKVYVVYRKEEQKMPANPIEIKAAKKENIEFLYNTNITKINGIDKVLSVELTKYENNHEEYVEVPNSKYILPADNVILAIGSHPSRIVKLLNIELDEKSKIKIDRNGQTSNKKVFAGGDVTSTKSTVAWAARSGRNAAYEIINMLIANNK